MNALPSGARIAGMQRKFPECSWYTARVGYNSGDGDSWRDCAIEIHDLQAQIPPNTSELEAKLMRQTISLSEATFLTAIPMLTSHREVMLGAPEHLQNHGGPEHLPVVDKLAGGDPYVIAVPTIDENPRESALLGLLRNERYGLSIHCSEKIRDHSSARQLYAPWIAALHLDALP